MNLQVDLCSVKLKNPLIAASGTFGFGREYDELYDISMWGAISVKGLTLEPRLGNPPHRIAETASGMLNSVGLQNPGVDAFIKNELPWLLSKKIPVIANVAGFSVAEYVKSIQKLSDSDVDMVELNISCPNVKCGGLHFGTEPDQVSEVVEAVRKVCNKPLIVKLSPNVTDIVEIATAAKNAGADAISLINTLTGLSIDARKRKPTLANITGGLSGPAVKPIALRMLWQIASKLDIPLVGMGGINSGEDIIEFILAGASAVMIGTANITDPLAGPRILAELTQFCKDDNIQNIADIVDGLQV